LCLWDEALLTHVTDAERHAKAEEAYDTHGHEKSSIDVYILFNERLKRQIYYRGSLGARLCSCCEEAHCKRVNLR